MKITQQQYVDFMTDSMKGKYEDQRIGQAFCNAFNPSEIILEDGQDLFYVDDEAALNFICTKLVNWCS